jgi:hypothetical protein
MPGRLPASTKKLDASKPKFAPISAVTKSSTTSASIAPFGLETAPIGSIDPSRPAFGSVVGRPGGVERPADRDRTALLRRHHQLAARDLAQLRSISSGAAARRGNKAATGLVPKIGWRPPAAGIAAGEFVKASRPAGVGQRPQVIDDHAGVVAAHNADESDPELARASRRLVDRELAGWKREPFARIDDGDRRPCCDDSGDRTPVDPAVAQVRRVLRDPAQAVRADRLCLGQDQCPRRRRSHRRAGPGPLERDGDASLQILDRQRRHQRRASATLSAINAETRVFESVDTPAMCGVSSRFGQPANGSTNPAARPRNIERSAAQLTGLERCGDCHLVDDAAAGGVDEHRTSLHRRDARRIEESRVEAVSGTWMLTTSARDTSTSSVAGSTSASR